MIKRVVLRVYGEVQGVFFRANAKKRAEELNLVGWVRNEPDDTVQIVAEGEEEKLRELINSCYNMPNAKIEKIKIKWEEAIGGFKEFEIKYI